MGISASLMTGDVDEMNKDVNDFISRNFSIRLTLAMKYCKFVSEALYGSSKNVQEVFESKTMIENINSDISNIINQHTMSIDENAYSSQKISVDCSAPIPNTPFFTTNTKKEYDFWGNEINKECAEEPQWGCCYDVTQLSKIKLVAINNSVLENKQEMFNKIKQNIENEVKLTVAGSQDIKNIQNSISKSETTSIRNIETVLEKAINMEIGSDQSVVIEAPVPLKCVQKCGEVPSAGEVNQSTQIEIYAKNIASTVLDDIKKNYISQTLKTKVEFEDTSSIERMVFISFTIFMIIFLGLDLKYLSEIAPKMGPVGAMLIGIYCIVLIVITVAFFIGPILPFLILLVFLLTITFIVGFAHSLMNE